MRPLRRATALGLLVLAGCDEGAVSGDAGWDAGSDLWPLVPEVTGPVVLAEDLDAPCGIALAGDTLYVAEEGAGRVLRIPVGGGAYDEVATGLASPRLLVDASGDLLVTSHTAATVVRLRQGAATEIAAGETGAGRVRAAGGFVYWVREGTGAADGAVRRAPIEGGAAEDVASALLAPRGLWITADRAYFTETGDGAVGYAPLSGGGGARWIDPDGVPNEVVADESAGDVFFSSPGRRSGGWIRSADPDLVSVAYVSFSPPGPGPLALDETEVLWATGQTLSHAPRLGGDYEDLVVQTSACDFAVSGEAVFWTDALSGRLLRLDRPN